MAFRAVLLVFAMAFSAGPLAAQQTAEPKAAEPKVATPAEPATSAAQAAPATPTDPATSAAPTAPATSGEALPVKVGIHAIPPFVMRDENGDWYGIGADLLKQVARTLDVRYSLVETDPGQLVHDVADGTLDVAIGAVPINGRDEREITFSQPYYSGSVGVAVRLTDQLNPRFILSLLMSPAFLSMLGLLTGPVFFVGTLIWLLERRANPGQFEPKPGRGVFSGFWWATVTMTTVGYGDKAPVTFFGRVLGMVWMFAALILAAVTTAQLAAGFSASMNIGVISRISDLAGVQVGTIGGSAANTELSSISIRADSYDSVEAGLNALEQGDIDAFVYDRSSLQWAVSERPDLYLTNLQFGQENYGLMLPNGDPRLKAINIAILNTIETQQWVMTLQRYLPPKSK